MKVLLFADVPTMDGVEFWNMLGKQCDLTIAFEQYPAESRIWKFSTLSNNYKSIFLQGISFGEGVNLSFGLKRVINEIPYDVFVVGDCKSSVQKSAIKEIVFNKKKFILAIEGGFPEVAESNLVKRTKAGYFNSASYYLSSGSACDAYLSSYGVEIKKVFRYNYAAFSEKDFLQATPMTSARERGLKKRFRLMDNIFTSIVEFSEEQGIDILLDIWKLAGINDANLLIISDGAKQKRLEKMVRKLALNNVVMIDYQPKETTRELLRISKALIYPARYDAWGLPVIEALSCGTPVISSYSVGSVHDLVRNDRTGYIQNIHEPIAWGEPMRKILKTDILLEKMRRDAFNSMKRYTIESRVKTYIDVFKKCAIIQHK